MAIGSKITGLVALLPAETNPPHISMRSSKVSLSSLRQCFCESIPSSNSHFQGHSIRRNSFAHELSLHAISDVCYARKDEFLFCEYFVDSVLDGNVHITSVIRLHDSLGELGQ